MIVSELMGGMGNQMFQYALGRSLSIKNKTKLVLDTKFLLSRLPRQDFVYRNYDLDLFNISVEFARDRISNKYGLDNQPRTKKCFSFDRLNYVTEQHFHFDPMVSNLGNNLYLNGYWQSEKYFKNIESIIRKDFTFKEPMSEKGLEMRDRIVNDNATCVNVRRGDFVANNILGTVDLSYFDKAIKYLSSKISNPVIYIFSDDIKWCEENLKTDHQSVIVGHEYAGAKFRNYFELMTLCKSFIIPNSTFAWWAAWLCKNPYKIVIAPKIWFRSQKYSSKDLVPESWVRI